MCCCKLSVHEWCSCVCNSRCEELIQVGVSDCCSDGVFVSCASDLVLSTCASDEVLFACASDRVLFFFACASN